MCSAIWATEESLTNWWNAVVNTAELVFDILQIPQMANILVECTLFHTKVNPIHIFTRVVKAGNKAEKSMWRIPNWLNVNCYNNII